MTPPALALIGFDLEQVGKQRAVVDDRLAAALRSRPRRALVAESAHARSCSSQPREDDQPIRLPRACRSPRADIRAPSSLVRRARLPTLPRRGHRRTHLDTAPLVELSAWADESGRSLNRSTRSARFLRIDSALSGLPTALTVLSYSGPKRSRSRSVAGAEAIGRDEYQYRHSDSDDHQGL